MLMIGFLSVAFLILNASQLTFLSIGHTGSAYARNSGPPAQIVEDEYERLQSKEQYAAETKMVQEKRDIENGVKTVPLPNSTEDSDPSESKSAGVS
jgi:hypothetical protein